MSTHCSARLLYATILHKCMHNLTASCVLQLFSSTAAALPAEIGPDGKLLEQAPMPKFAGAGRFVMAWRHRMAAQRRRRLQQNQQSAQQ